MVLSRVDQSRASAGGDVVAGDKIVAQISSPASRVEKLMERLAFEIETNVEARGIIDSLQFFYKQRQLDDVVGLEAKLSKAGRNDEIIIALEKKELFVKQLDKFALYSSAQSIFAHLLAKVEHEFNYTIYPGIDAKTQAEVNFLVTSQIVNPIVNECGIGPLDINHSVVMGMVYWLAEQCFVRWHQ